MSDGSAGSLTVLPWQALRRKCGNRKVAETGLKNEATRRRHPHSDRAESRLADPLKMNPGLFNRKLLSTIRQGTSRTSAASNRGRVVSQGSPRYPSRQEDFREVSQNRTRFVIIPP